MAQHAYHLNDNQWTFGQVARQPFTAANVFDLPDVIDWLPATVPGNVRTDLLALGRIPDPFYAENYQKSLWVEDADWWYRREIQVDDLAAEQRAFLIFEGIDYLSAIFINGQEMARHEGMFSRQIIEITDALQNSPAEVAVRLWGSSALPRRKLNRWQRLWQTLAAPLHGSWTGIYPDRSATLKCQMSFGWDFAPPVRTMGIWDEVSLKITGPVGITHISATGQPKTTKSLPPQATHAPAQLSVTLTLNADRPQPAKLDIKLHPANFNGPQIDPGHFSLDLPAGPSTHRLDFNLPKAALWQPWDRGEPSLYTVQINLISPDGIPLDTAQIRTGIRSIEVDRWHFIINGQPEFIRGLNWVPADSFPGRLRAEDYRTLLAQAKTTGANLLRVWGGGLREKKAFYDLCDELGLLVWQEFPFACLFLGNFPQDAAYLNQVEAECSAIVRQLRHHPSLALWCGGNEFNARRNQPLRQTLANVIKQHDPARPFSPVSPNFGPATDRHNWDVWHGDEPIWVYNEETAEFLSEFGLQALPHADTMRAMLPDPTQDWPSHHADVPKLRRYSLPFIVSESKTPRKFRIKFFDFSKPADIDPAEFLQININASQRAQAAALQTAIEHMRRRKGEAGGACLWQFNEPWPAISWAIVDYFGRPKLAYTHLKNWYNPVLVSLKFPVGYPWQLGDILAAEIRGINDTLENFAECALEIKLDETAIHRQTLDLPANSAQLFGAFNQRLSGPIKNLSLSLRHQGQLLAQNHYDLSWHDEIRGSFTRRLRRRLADWLLR